MEETHKYGKWWWGHNTEQHFRCRLKSTPPTDAYTNIPTQMPIHATKNWHHQNARKSSTSSACGTTEANNTRIPLPTSPNSGSHLSQLSAPLFTEDRCSSISEEELEVDAEVTLINRRNKPNRTFMQQLGDKCPHQQLWITQPRVIQTK